MRRLSTTALLVIVLAAGCGGGGAQSPRSPASSPDVRSWVAAEKLPPAAVPGATLFSTSGCTACHTYLGTGVSNLGAPDLSAWGLRHHGVDFDVRVLRCASCVTPGSPMPKFASLGATRLHQLAVFLEASKGKR